MHSSNWFMDTRGKCRLMLEVPGCFYCSSLSPASEVSCSQSQDWVWPWKLSRQPRMSHLDGNVLKRALVSFPSSLSNFPPNLRPSCWHVLSDKSCQSEAPNKNLKKTHFPCVYPFKVKTIKQMLGMFPGTPDFVANNVFDNKPPHTYTLKKLESRNCYKI